MIQINAHRFLEDLENQGRIGWNEGEGLYREAYSKEYFMARDYIQQRMEEAGIETRIDSVGNLFGRIKGQDPKARVLLTGSHLDAVKGGGILDGSLGVVAAIEALRSIKERGILPRHTIEAVGFIAEEGGALGGTFGSRSFTGQMETPPSDEVLNNFGISQKDIYNAKAEINNYAAYLELHIEQGPFLWDKGISIGIPTVIVGITRYKGCIKGEANHAGSTPMEKRKDALYETVVLLHEWLDFMKTQKEAVCNVGYIEVKPGQIGIVPGETQFGIEIRAPHQDITKVAVEKLKDIFSKPRICSAELELWVEKPAVRLHDNIITSIEKVSQDLKIESKLMPSWASHDASPLARVIPTGMIFVPSIKGISHNKEEFTEKDDLVRGTTILANTLLRLDTVLI